MWRPAGFVTFVLIAASSAWACAPGTCSDAESHCVDAHTMETCSGSVDAVGQSRHSKTSTCSGSTPFCVDTTSGRETSAACAESNVKAEECAAAPTGDLCEAGEPFQCRNGYLFRLPPCDADHTCKIGSTSRYALCALTLQDGSCDGATQEYHCDGDSQIHCFDGYVMSKTSCVSCDPSIGQCDGVLGDAGVDAG